MRFSTVSGQSVLESFMAIRAALIGCGEHARDNVLPSILQLSDSRLIAVCDPVAANMERAANLIADANRYDDYRKLLKDERVECLVVVAHPQLHFEIGVVALSRGIHVFVEKPPA